MERYFMEFFAPESQRTFTRGRVNPMVGTSVNISLTFSRARAKWPPGTPAIEARQARMYHPQGRAENA
jgi:hypothetical protein